VSKACQRRIDGSSAAFRCDRRKALTLPLVLVFITVTAGRGRAQTAADMDARLDSLFGSHAPYRAFLDQLKQAVASGDKKAVASLVAYPLRTKLAGVNRTVQSSARFIAMYDAIMTDKVRAAVEKQTYATLFANAEGVSIGDGAIWFSAIDTQDTIRIIAINGS